MTAREKIENLTHSWYGFSVAAALWSLLQNGIGVFSLALAVASTLFSLAVAYFFGQRLLARSSLTRVFLLVMSVISVITGSLMVLRMGTAFFQTWRFGLLLHIAFGLASLGMNLKSLRVLSDGKVASYCR